MINYSYVFQMGEKNNLNFNNRPPDAFINDPALSHKVHLLLVVLFFLKDRLAFAIHYFPPTIADVLQCVSAFSSVCTLSFFSRDQRAQKEVNSFLTQPGPYYVNCFSLSFSFYFYTHELGAHKKSCTKWLI